MADRQSTRSGREDTERGDRTPRTPRPPRAHRRDEANGSRLTAADAGLDALRQVVELTGKELEGVSGVQPSDDGWTVMVDVVEDRKIPSTSDVIATYEAELGPDGELLSYRRIRRYVRGRGDNGVG
jgi:Gas vesicle synthesis protein GvpO